MTALFPILALGSASVLGHKVDLLFLALLLITGSVAGLVALGIITACIVYRRGAPANRAPIRISSTKIEITWTIIPLIIFLGLFAWAAVLYFQMARPPANATEIHVLGKQWMWEIQHLDGRREVNELHIPVGQPVALIMISQDVIHSFFIPAFRTKMDVIPGGYTREWFTPTQAGQFHLFCAEYCGENHSRMGGTIYVMEPASYQQWLAGSAATGPAGSLSSAGQRLFLSRGCAGCHAEHGTVPAPLLDGIYNRQVALSNGQTVIADENYLRDSILLPNKQIVAGYQAVMPTYQGQLSEQEVLQLITYLKSLSAKSATAP